MAISDSAQSLPPAPEANPPQLLLLEDHQEIADTLLLYFQQQEWQCQHFVYGAEALVWSENQRVDVIILDLMLPDGDGIDFCRQFRQHSQAPIVMLTARSTEADIIQGLQAGADDYVCKPFSPKELVARIQSQLRRLQFQVQRVESDIDSAVPKAQSQSVTDWHYHSLHFAPEQQRLNIDGQPIKLTKTEWQLIDYLARHPGRVLSREQLIAQVLGPDFTGSDRTIDTHCYNLRQKIEVQPHRPQYLHTVHGIGYRFEYQQAKS